MPVVGFTCSCFDLFHAGHVAMLEEARDNCDILVVGLQTDPSIDRPEKRKPIQSLLERHIQLVGSKYVDKIYVYETEADLEKLLMVVRPDIRFLGEEYEFMDFTGKQWCIANDVQFYYNKREHGWSTTELRQRAADSFHLKKVTMTT